MIANPRFGHYFNAMPELDNMPPSLRQEFSLIQIGGVFLHIVFSMFFLYFWPPAQAFQWLFQSLVIWLLVAYRARTLLHLNRPANNQPLYHSLGTANLLTVFRGLLIAITAGFIFQPDLSQKVILIPALSYLIAAVIDRIDGYVARHTGHESMLGTRLDVELDALGLVIAPLLAIWLGQIHWSYLLVSLAYYLFQWGMHRRKRLDLPVNELPRNMGRRAVAGFQMGFLAVVLWPVLAPPATVIAGFAFMFPLLSGFATDWLTVSGRISLQDKATQAFFQHTEYLIQGVFLPLARALIMALLSFSLLQKAVFNPATGMAELLLYSSLLASAGAILLGIAGRFFSLILSCLLCWFYLSYEMSGIDIMLLISVILVMQLGTGKYSLWRWDERWVNRYDGAQSRVS